LLLLSGGIDDRHLTYITRMTYVPDTFVGLVVAAASATWWPRCAPGTRRS